MSKIQTVAKEINCKTEVLNNKLKSFQKELLTLNQKIASVESSIASQKEKELEQKRLEEAAAREKALAQEAAEKEKAEKAEKAAKQAEAERAAAEATMKAEEENKAEAKKEKKPVKEEAPKKAEKKEAPAEIPVEDKKPQEEQKPAQEAEKPAEKKAERPNDRPAQRNNNRGQDERRSFNNDGQRPFNNDRRNNGERTFNGPKEQREGRFNNNNGDRPPRQFNNNNGDRPPRQFNNNGDRPPRQFNNNGDRPPRQFNNGQGQGQGGPRPFNQGQGQGGFNRNNNGPRRPAPIDLTPVAEKEKVSNYDPNKKMYREKNGEKKIPAKKTLVKSGFVQVGMDDDERVRGRRKKAKKDVAASRPEPIKIDHAVITGENVSIKEFSEKIGKPVAEIIKKLFMLGIMATINHDIDFDTAALVAADFDITLEQKLEKTYEEVLQDSDLAADIEADMVERPPVVTVMGHVDHGKTSLLDAIRYSNVTDQEAGGITQHIGAYMIKLGDRPITFIDTPGHEAFTSMRARGAQVTDIAIIVVAADDGIMPQTIEAINHAKAAKVPIIVAVNKIDKPAADIDKVKQELTEHGLVAEEWGGDTVIAPVSAKTKEGLDNLLEMILLVADVAQLKAAHDRKAKGTIIEAKLDKGRGPVATVLVQNGTLRVGDTIVAGTAYGRVRAMLDDRGNKVEAASPSTPVEVLGFNDVPDAGDIMNALDDEKLSKQLADERKNKIKAQQLKAKSKASLEDLFSKIKEGEMKELNIIVKADVQGSVEAVKQAVEKLSNEEVKVCTIHGGVGAITETDVMFASAANAIIIGFNVRPDPAARALAEREKVDVRLYRVIYSAIEDITKAMKGMLAPVFTEVIQGHAEVRATFKVSDVGTIAGSYVTDGKITRNSKVRLLRDNVVLFEGEIASLKRMKDDAKEVASGYECGIAISGYNDIKEADVIEAYTIEQVKQD